MRAALLLLAFVGACKPNEDNFTEKYIKAYCDFAQRCYAAEFFYQYDDKGECVNKNEDYWADYGSAVTSQCEFDADKAAECLDNLNQSCKEIGDDLDEFDPQCDAVWDCGEVYGATD